MKTKAYDPETKQWRTDYVVMPDGQIFQTLESSVQYHEYKDLRDCWTFVEYTNEVDVDNSDLWESDIVTDDINNKYIIKKIGNMFVCVPETGPNKELEYMISLGIWKIGNIFTTPELLEVVP